MDDFETGPQPGGHSSIAQLVRLMHLTYVRALLREHILDKAGVIMLSGYPLGIE